MRFFRIDQDAIIIGMVCLVVVLQCGSWLNKRVFHPVVYRPPPGMLYLGAPSSYQLSFNPALWCVTEGCIMKIK